MYYDHLIKNGTLITPNDTFNADIYIKNGKIAAITNERLEGDAKEVTDASDKLVLPGFIDSHVHSRDGYNGAHYKEDFFHSSMAGAAGGITTILEMPNSNPAVYSADTLNMLVECITPKAHTDFGIWGLCLGDLNIDQLIPLKEAGVVGFKFFWGYAVDSDSYQLIYNYTEGMENVIPPPDQGEVYRIFRQVAKTGRILAIHAENFEIIKALTHEVKKSGDSGYRAMLRSRPPVTETTIIETAILIAKELGTRLHILHLAAGDGVDLIKAAQNAGLPVTGETCPHYLAFTDKDADRLGSLIKGYPPVRTQADQNRLWAGLNDGTLSSVCSDHAPHSYEEKQKCLWEAPAGTASIETMAPVLIDAVSKGKLTYNKLSEVMSANPAKLFGLYPRKGSLNIGSDADMVIIDPSAKYTFDQANMHSRIKLSPYHGMTFSGRIVQTVLRGMTVAKDGRLVSGPAGRFIRPD
ncbi:MAG: L-hydantoinase [Firmicutes bacterium ADurb.Bin182]|nr:MAG: L-hydantoinase [Firmicutes bacterium ADurb.Bin182]